MQDYELSYYINNGKHIYASARLDDGRLQLSMSLKAESLDNLPRNIQRTLDRARIEFDNFVGQCQKTNEPILKQGAADVIRAAIGGRRTYRKPLILSELVEKYIAGAKEGSILNDKEKKYPASTVRLMGYAYEAAITGGIDKLAVSELKPEHFQQLRARLTNTKAKGYKEDAPGLSANTIETYNNLLVLMISRARGLGWHSNNLDAYKKGVRAKGEDVDYAIAYNDKELEKLYNHKYDHIRHSEARDVFIFGCYTCLRHSDYYLTDYVMSLMEGNILHLRNLKTGNSVYIPLHPIALRIYQQYGGNMPKIAYESMRRKCREITKLAGFDSPCLFSRVQGGVLVKEHRPKWDLTTTHTMRRSFATNAFISGMPERMIMKIGGWKSYGSFERYLRLSGLDIAKLAMEQPFYKDWKWG